VGGSQLCSQLAVSCSRSDVLMLSALYAIVLHCSHLAGPHLRMHMQMVRYVKLDNRSAIRERNEQTAK